jgi:hypothetical protein
MHEGMCDCTKIVVCEECPGALLGRDWPNIVVLRELSESSQMQSSCVPYPPARPLRQLDAIAQGRKNHAEVIST